MRQDESEFCAALQAEWSVDSVVWTRGEVTIRASRCVGLPYPDPLGRPGHLVMAEPHVFRETESAEIHFKSAEWCQIVDEFCFATVPADAAAGSEEFTGRYFRCFSRSRLLTELRAARPGKDPAQLKHYQMATESEVLDIVSTEAPEVVIRRAIQQ